MTQAYYYLIASLPVLTFEEKPPLTTEEFLDRCRGQLSSADFSLMEKICADTAKIPSSNFVLTAWTHFNHNLRNEIAYYRAKRSGKDPLDHLRGERPFEPLWAQAVSKAAQLSDPLQAERLLDEQRWRFLDDLVAFQYFNLEWLSVYALKLKILERYQVLESPEGKALYDEYKRIELALN